MNAKSQVVSWTAAVVAALPLFVVAATVRVPSGDVEALVNALNGYQSSSDWIQLEPGVYDLSNVQLEASTTNGGSHLGLMYANMEGLGETCDDVRLVGDGTLRVLRTDNSKSYTSMVRNITITNGYARAVAGDNIAGCGGGIYGYHFVTNCAIIGNKADLCGGGACRYTYLDGCRILNNVCVSGDGGGAYKPNWVRNSIVKGNSAMRGGGVYGDATGAVIDSVVSENEASGYGGGICAVPTVSNSLVSLNVAAGGAGLFAWNLAQSKAYDSLICSNRNGSVSSAAAAGGGGVRGYQVFGGAIFANYVNYGGGASAAVLTDVDVHDNCATGSGDNGYGGGLYNCTATNCTIRNNIANGKNSFGNNAYGSRLVACDVSGMDVHGGSLLNCTFHDIGGEIAIENPFASAKKAATAVLRNFVAATNCLIHSNILTGYGATLIVGDSSQKYESRLVSCTIVSNRYGRIFGYFKDVDHPLYVENCVFSGNRYYNDIANDLSNPDKETLTVGAVQFADAAYGLSSGLFTAANLPSYTLRNLYKFGADGFGADPKFVGSGDPENPYAIRRSSPLRGRGAYSDWMGLATDIRGEGYPRSDSGMVDIGCYQCWIKPVGFKVICK